MPHNTVDPIVLAALLVLDLQTIVSREVNPIHPAVVTVGSIHGGTKHNIIPNEVRLQLTLRAFRPEVGDQLVEGIRRRAKGLAEAHQAPAPGRRRSARARRRRSTRRAWSPRSCRCWPKELGDVERRRGRADDGGRGLRPVRPGRRADLHVPARDDPARAASPRRRRKGETLPSLHSALYHPDAAAEPPDGRPGDDGGRRRPAAAEALIGEGRTR